MDINMSQPMLFDFADTATGAVEFFPEVWSAVEGLTSSELLTRREALDRLIVLDAPRLSPLVAYVLATRIFEPDLELRCRVVTTLGKVLSPSDTGKITPDAVRSHLKVYCYQMEHRGVFQLLEVAEDYPEAESSVAAILNLCSQSGIFLVDIMIDRKVTLPLRRQAINFIGRVGFLDAIPALERLEERLETRLNGQKAMPFAPPTSYEDENSLLPVIQTTLTLLREP
jgi:hypothetical protein